MNQIIKFDVLIVYNGSLAVSASSDNDSTPFKDESKNHIYNGVYSYFLEICTRLKIKAAFTTSSDIVGPGLCKSFWTYKNKTWQRSDKYCQSNLIFDKFSPVRKSVKAARKLLFSSHEVKAFNDPRLFRLFFDKYKTYLKLSEFAIPTINIDKNTLEGIKKALAKLSKTILDHPNSNDFHRDIVMKDKYGAGGLNVNLIKEGDYERIFSILKNNNKASFVFQPLVNFDKGFSYKGIKAPTDIRFIYLNGEIVQTYLRIAKSGEFRCNEHQGGLLTYVKPIDIPWEIIAKANLIAKSLKSKRSLFTLDFIVSNSGNSYLLEGNTSPGLDWNINLKRNEIEAKKLIRLIVRDILNRVRIKSNHNKHIQIADQFPSVPSQSYPVIL